MKKINLLGYLSMALILLFTSCDQQGEMEILEVSNSSIQIDKSKQIILQPTTLTKSEISEVSCGESKVVTLTAGQHIDVGTITVSNDETNLYVIYETTGNWVITETHLYVGPEAGIPLNGGGNPRIGHFPYHGVDDEPFTIPLADLGDDFVIVAHAVVDQVINGQTVQSETAFGCGEFSFPGNRWGCYFDYEKQECEEEECLPVFGRKNSDAHTSCINYPVNSIYHQGWSNDFPYLILFDSNVWELDIFKRNDDCDISNVAKIGRVEMVKTDINEVEVSYIIFDSEYGGDASGSFNVYGISKIHFYIGSEEYPYNAGGTLKPTIDASNFYEKTLDYTVKRPDSFKMTWNGSSDPNTRIYITAYAEVCEIED